MVDRRRGCVIQLPSYSLTPSAPHSLLRSTYSISGGMSEAKINAASGSSSSLDAVLKRRRASIIEVVDAKSAVDLATAQSYSENVFLFVPNLIGEFIQNHSRHRPLTSRVARPTISESTRFVVLDFGRQGYTRVILAALAMHYMNYHPKYSTVAYCVSQLLDAVDGHAARYLGQASKFGAVLDMVTDRYAWLSAPPRILILISDTVTGQPRAACSVISLRCIHNMRSSFSSLSRSTSAVTTCTCTGTRFRLPSLPPRFHSSA